MKDQKLTPRIAETARGLWTVYFVTAVACFFAYHAAGMSWTDAFIHMCSTMGLGGFAAYDASFGHFQSPAIEAVAIGFMTLAGINFGLYFVAWRKRSLAVVWNDVEARTYLMLVPASVVVVALFLAWHGVYPTVTESLRHAAFNVVSIATTTGFATVDYALWPIFAPVFMLFLCSFTTCAGSTGGDVYKRQRLNLWHVVHTAEQIDWLAAHKTQQPHRVFLKLNSGMNRLGFKPPAFRSAWARLNQLPQVDEISLMTHFSDADGARGVAHQVAAFETAAQDLPGERCLANSAAILRHELKNDWVRAGILSYGSAPDFPCLLYTSRCV